MDHPLAVKPVFFTTVVLLKTGLSTFDHFVLLFYSNAKPILFVLTRCCVQVHLCVFVYCCFFMKALAIFKCLCVKFQMTIGQSVLCAG